MGARHPHPLHPHHPSTASPADASPLPRLLLVGDSDVPEPVRASGEERVRALLDAVLAVGGDLDPHSTLERIVAAAAQLADARYVALGVLDRTGEALADFITYGIEEEQRQQIGSLPKGHGILGLLISDARPLRLHNLNEHVQSYGFPAHHPSMTSFLGCAGSRGQPRVRQPVPDREAWRR